MTLSLEPLYVNSLKEACVSRLEELILSGELKAGEHLPAEREFALALGVSRPVLHEALVDLASKGLVSILPRRGVVVNDFRKSGSTAILSSLLAYNNGELNPQFIDSLFGMRLLVETETARLAALHATAEQIAELQRIRDREVHTDPADTATLTTLDFDFHLAVSIASGSLIYPLILNSFKNVYTHFTSTFFKYSSDSVVLTEVHNFHKSLITAIERREEQRSAGIMHKLLSHGEKYLKDSMKQIEGGKSNGNPYHR